MKTIILLFWTIITAPVFSQNQSFEIVYKYKQVSKDVLYGNYETNLNTYLIGNMETSIYMEDFNNILNENTSSQNAISLKSEENPVFFKDKKQNQIIFKDHIRLKFFYIKDSLSNFDWVITDETKKILGYDCQKATLYFRGRIFEVYFTPDIAISDGPWKLYGLPGMILEVHSNDEIASIDIVAEKITLNKPSNSVENPYAKKEIITRDQFVKLYQLKYEESLNNVNDSGKASPLPKGFFEYYIEK